MFDSLATNLVPGDTNDTSDVFARARSATLTLEKTTLSFGGVTSGGRFVAQTAPQTVRLIQDGVGSVAWTAVSSHPCLQVTPASGSGSGVLAVSIAPAEGVPPNGTINGTIVVTATGAINTTLGIAVTLTLTPAGSSGTPFGTVDTPNDNRPA